MTTSGYGGGRRGCSPSPGDEYANRHDNHAPKTRGVVPTEQKPPQRWGQRDKPNLIEWCDYRFGHAHCRGFCLHNRKRSINGLNWNCRQWTTTWESATSPAEKDLFEEVAGVSSTAGRTTVVGPHSMSNARENIKHSDPISRPFDDECGISRTSLGRPPGRYQRSHVRGSGSPPCCREHHCRGEPPSCFSPPGTPTAVATGVQVAAVHPPQPHLSLPSRRRAPPGLSVSFPMYFSSSGIYFGWLG